MQPLDCEAIDHDLGTGPAAIPVTVLTGFLGAGKTTLMNRILSGDHGLRVAVLVNDFGSLNIDAELIVGVESDVISLANGCICCTIRDDLIETTMATINRPERPEYILLEASGVADPSAIMVTFGADCFRDRIRLDSIICVVDAEQVLAVPELMELKIRQMAFADMIILNKVDLVDRARLDQIRAWLDSRFHRYRLVEASHGDVPLEVLLSVGRFDPAQADLPMHAVEDHHAHDPSNTFSSWCYESELPVSLEALREVMRQLPSDIYRAKGVIYTSDVPERRAVLQVVGKRVDISLWDAWGERTPRTQLVVIGGGGIDTASLQVQFELALAANQTTTS
ncbi:MULTISPECIES: GTP-binding protein [unclassified Mycobacterium]|uniref:CobW family GTP-binding protein n=1 Tax=unclassified Mycobacterium TaxID=2642494 RepID=UPI0029C6A06B|nr:MULTISPECIES: GTP-binding protein [unclassified Mycobacterium]